MADNLPSLSVTTPTPPRLTPTSGSQSWNTPTSKALNSLPPSYRLLYRGALSLPDSLLLLDGLTFAARLNSPSKHSTFNLLQNPLALALESMRGRPSLRFMGTVLLRDVWLDESGDIEMDIHPHAILTRVYFENMFCLLPFSASSSSNSTEAQRSDIGIKVALGDSNGPETTEIVVFAQLISTADCPNAVRLSVARLTQRPLVPQVQKRVPRPDDPTPRKPPAFFLQELKRAGSLGAGARELKRVASGNIIGGTKRQKLTNGTGIAADLGSGVRVTNAEDDRLFKVPEVPKQIRGKVKGKEKEDVFGDIAEVIRVDCVESTSGKGKQKSEEGPIIAVEKANKNIIKRATIEYLSRTKDPTNASRFIDKTHPDFKELYGFIYRGVGYALRAKIRDCELDFGVVNRLIDMHALMYLGGCGGSAAKIMVQGPGTG